MAAKAKNNLPTVVEKSIELGGRKLTVSAGKVAEQSDMAVMASYGDTVLLATVVSSPVKQEMDYFPLFIEYQERLYAGGRIKGSRWVKREGRPTDEEILTGRVIDRSIRPLFPKDYNKKEVQIIVTVLSVDLENDPAVLAPIAVSAALSASKLPWKGPVSVLKVGLSGGKYVINPTAEEMKNSEMDLVVSTTKEAIVMIEAGANQVAEEKILEGIEFAQKEGTKVIKFIEDFAHEVGPEKEVVENKASDKDLEKQVKKLVEDRLDKILEEKRKTGGKSKEDLDELKAALIDQIDLEHQKDAIEILDHMFTEKIRNSILKGVRPDGRKHTEIRKLWSEVGVLPRTHGSAIFTRGSTQVMSIATLGAPSMGQLLESAEGEEEKRYMHHYSMPPYSTGETGRVGSPSRREIGHGALAERALEPVLPTEEEFPYAIRVVSEVLSSNGSTSMASTCGSTLSLMDAGVPIKAPVSGIAMGLVVESDKNFAILSDIAGIEDFNGDMDFKVTGTKDGVTALQLDVKTLNLTLSMLKDAIAQAKEGRSHILSHMMETIKETRSTVSKYAPKIISITIDPAKIGEVVGPGGKTIKKIIAETGAGVDIDDDGTVTISAVDASSVEKAKTTVENLVKELQPGEVYEGEVKRIESYGAFVEVLPGKTGLVHVSDMSEEYVSRPEDIVKLGDKKQVRVKEVDNMGRINLSFNLDPAKDKEKEEGRGERRVQSGRDSRGGYSPRQGGFDRRGGGQGGRGRDSRGGRSRSFSGNREGGENRGFRGARQSGERSSGPHFPTSRLVSPDSNKSRGRFGR